MLASWRRVAALGALEQDSLLYSLAALFALATALFASPNEYRAWGQMAAVAYLAATVLCLGIAVLSRRRQGSQDSIRRARIVVVGALLIGAVVVPLVAELTWRAHATPGEHAQPEVSVIERAGDRAATGKDPYLAAPTSAGTPAQSDAKTFDASTFFPYLPGMVPFGMINALKAPAELTDARVALSGFTLIVAAIAFSSLSALRSRRLRAFQFLVVLPTGALPMVTGGDDLPVLALMLVGILLAERRHPVWSGLALGAAATLKLTAWPVAVLLALVVRDAEERPARVRYGLAVLAVLVPVVAIGAGLDVHAFIDNVIRFPLGLAKVQSPAQSPLLGQLLVHFFPNHRRTITIGLLALGAVIVVAIYRRHRLRSVADVCRFSSYALAIATVLAPATRFGYLIYPANFFVWAYLLDGLRAPETVVVNPVVAPSMRRKSRLLVSVTGSSSAEELAGPGETSTAPSTP